jgi:hypothetical protein
MIDDETQLSLKTDYDLLKRVLINLVENSLLAMPDGGTILVSGRQEPILKKVILQLEDEGGSLPAESERLFEPFFTTRPAAPALPSRQIIERLAVRFTLAGLSAVFRARFICQKTHEQIWSSPLDSGC